MSVANRLRVTIPVIIRCATTVCLLTSAAFTQMPAQEKRLINIEDLISSLEIAKTDRTPITRIINLIREHGVDFQLTPDTENRIRAAGSYLSKKRLNDLVAAVRSNYRPRQKSYAEPSRDGTQSNADTSNSHSGSPVSTPTPKWPIVGDDDIDRVRKRLNDLENRPSGTTEYELAQELKQLFYRPGYSYVGEETPERFLFALCTTRPILQHYVGEFKSSPRVRSAVQMSIQKMILLRDQIAEIYGSVFKLNIEGYCERYKDWQSFRQAMPDRLLDITDLPYVNNTCGTLRDLRRALLSAGLVDSDAACPHIKIPTPGAPPNEAARSILTLHVDEIIVRDNGEEVDVDWSFDIYLEDKNSERLAAQIHKREYNLKNNQLPYHDYNPPQTSWNMTIQGEAVIIRVEARRTRTNVVLLGKQEINLNVDDLNKRPVPVNPPIATPEGRSLGEFTIIISITKNNSYLIDEENTLMSKS